jgi:amino acid transporter
MIGFDCVSTLAEEVKNPKRDMPIGIVGCILVVTLIYCLMALTLVLMVPYKVPRVFGGRGGRGAVGVGVQGGVRDAAWGNAGSRGGGFG